MISQAEKLFVLTFEISVLGGLFLFQSSVFVLGIDGLVQEILNCYLLSWHPSMALAQHPVTRMMVLSKDLWGKISWLLF
jgi:hypothetical protein